MERAHQLTPCRGELVGLCTSVGGNELAERQAILLCQALQRLALVHAHRHHNWPAQQTQHVVDRQAKALLRFLPECQGVRKTARCRQRSCGICRRRRLCVCLFMSYAAGDWPAPGRALPARPPQLPPVSSEACKCMHVHVHTSVVQACLRMRQHVSRHPAKQAPQTFAPAHQKLSRPAVLGVPKEDHQCSEVPLAPS